jgi:hypothetical protein
MSFEDAEQHSATQSTVTTRRLRCPRLTQAEQPPVVPATPEGETSPTPVQPSFPRDEHGRFMRPEPVTPDLAADTFDGGQFNPDTLAPELQPAWKQLQAAFTRKTQEIALERQQFEGLDPQVAREAVELYSALQDPSYLQQFHQELTVALQQTHGLSPAQASAEAATQMEQASAQPQGASATSWRR